MLMVLPSIRGKLEPFEARQLRPDCLLEVISELAIASIPQGYCEANNGRFTNARGLREVSNCQKSDLLMMVIDVVYKDFVFFRDYDFLNCDRRTFSYVEDAEFFFDPQ